MNDDLFCEETFEEIDECLQLTTIAELEEIERMKNFSYDAPQQQQTTKQKIILFDYFGLTRCHDLTKHDFTNQAKPQDLEPKQVSGEQVSVEEPLSSVDFSLTEHVLSFLSQKMQEKISLCLPQQPFEEDHLSQWRRNSTSSS